MNNEPVAWIDPRELDMTVSTSVTKHKQFDTDIPLYTHPAKTPMLVLDGNRVYPTEKTLTDEEINQVWNFGEDWLNIWTDGTFSSIHYVEFARAILKKASEK